MGDTWEVKSASRSLTCAMVMPPTDRVGPEVEREPLYATEQPSAPKSRFVSIVGSNRGPGPRSPDRGSRTGGGLLACIFLLGPSVTAGRVRHTKSGVLVRGSLTSCGDGWQWQVAAS